MKNRLALSGALTLSTLLAPAQGLISLNFFSIGKPSSPSIWVDGDPSANIATLTIDEGESAGVWETTAWVNIDFGNPFSANVFGPVEVTGTEGSSATLLFHDRRNSGPYNWLATRDDSDVVNVGNATLLDGHTNGTEVDGGGANPWPMAITDFEIQDIPFQTYDVIVYIGGNGAQYLGGGTNIRATGQLPADPLDPATKDEGVLSFVLSPGEPDGTLTEVTGPGETGNYVVFSGLTDPTFRVQIWGSGFSHIGASGIQIQNANPAEPFVLSIVPSAEIEGGFDLSWPSQEGKTYNLRSSVDLALPLNEWELLEGGIESSPDGNSYPVTVDGTRRFYVVEQLD